LENSSSVDLKQEVALLFQFALQFCVDTVSRTSVIPISDNNKFHKSKITVILDRKRLSTVCQLRYRTLSYRQDNISLVKMAKRHWNIRTL